METPSTWPTWTGATAKSSTRTRGILQVQLLFFPLLLRCDAASVPSFSLVLAAENHTYFYPHVVESCCKIFDSFTVHVVVKAQHVSTTSTGVASNTQGRGADVINAQQRLSVRLEASDWLARQRSAWTLTNTYPPPEFTDVFQSFPQMSWFPENVFELMLTETLQCPQLETGLFPRVLFACCLSVRGDGLL